MMRRLLRWIVGECDWDVPMRGLDHVSFHPAIPEYHRWCGACSLSLLADGDTPGP